MRNQSHAIGACSIYAVPPAATVCNRSCALGVVAVCARKNFDLDYVGTSSTNTGVVALAVMRYTAVVVGGGGW